MNHLTDYYFHKSCDSILFHFCNRIHRIEEEGLIQVPSKSSLNFCGRDNYYKLLPNVRHKETYLDLKHNSTGLSCSQLSIHHEIKYVGEISFFCFCRLPHQPLSRDQAKSCLYQFIIDFYEALDFLHRNLQFAHLDVKIENICFNSDLNQS